MRRYFKWKLREKSPSDSQPQPIPQPAPPASKAVPKRKPKKERPLGGMPWVVLVEAFLMRLRIARSCQLYQDNVRRTIRRFTDRQHLNAINVADVTQLDFQKYVSERSCEAWSPPGTYHPPKRLSVVTINNEISILNALFSYAGPRANWKGHRDNLGLIQEPPFLRLLREPEPLPVTLTLEQLSDFVAATKFAKSPLISVCCPALFWRAVLVLDSITALRRGALLSIKRPDDQTLLVKRQLALTEDLAKNARAEIITLGTRDDVIELLASLPSRAGEPLLPWKRTDGRPLSLSHFNSEMKRFQQAAGIAPDKALKTKHLRSTAATEILAEQFSTDTARKRLGHKSENVIRKHYQARVVSHADRNASDFLAARVMDLISISGN